MDNVPRTSGDAIRKDEEQTDKATDRRNELVNDPQTSGDAIRNDQNKQKNLQFGRMS